jgi:bifunctional non-homologous end joining protein LigD
MVTRTITLHAASNSPAGKFYTVDIAPAGGDLFTVDYHHGAVGGRVAHGTKTKTPVPMGAADKLFNELVLSKVEGESHYRPVADAPTQYAAPPAVEPDVKTAVCLPPRLLNDVVESEIVELTASDYWYSQIKHDGDRVQLHARDGKVTLFSARSGKTRACPKPIADMIANYPAPLVLDGELVGDVLWVFDLLSAMGHDFTPEPYFSRMESLELILGVIWNRSNTGATSIRLVATARTHAEKYALIADAKRISAEGVVFIKATAPYEAGRPSSGGNNLRWKFLASASVVVTAHNVKCSMVVALGDASPIGTVSMLGKGTLPPVGAVIEVTYLYCQGSLVQARYKGLRSDLTAADCTRAKLQFKGGIDPLV